MPELPTIAIAPEDTPDTGAPIPERDPLDDHDEVLRLIAGQLTAHPVDAAGHEKLRHFHAHGRLPDPEPVEAEAVEEPES